MIMSAVELSTFVSYGTSAILGETDPSRASNPSLFQKLFNALPSLGPSKESAPASQEKVSRRLIGSLAMHTPLIGNRLLGLAQSFFDLFGLLSPGGASKGFQGTGFLKSMGLVKSPLGIRSGIKKVQAAKERADKMGIFDASLQITRGATSSVATAIYIPAHAVSIFDSLRRSPSLLKTAKIMGTVSGSLFTFVSGLSLFSSSLSLHYLRLLHGELRAIVKDSSLPEDERVQKAFNLLKERSTVSNEEKEEICRQIYSDERCASASGEQILAAINKVESLVLANKLGSLSKGLSQKSIRRIVAGTDADAKSVVDYVFRDSRRRTWIKGIATTVSVISMGVGIAAMIFLSKEAVLVLTVFGILSSLVLLAVDTYDMFVQFDLASERKFDKLWIIASTALMMSVMMVVTALADGILPIILASGIGVVWFLTAIASYMRLQKVSESDAPSLS